MTTPLFFILKCANLSGKHVLRKYSSLMLQEFEENGVGDVSVLICESRERKCAFL
jgi:hypothetical protein